MAAVVIHIIMDGKSCSFYSPWPLSWYVQQNWPEVYFKACHWIIERTTWYSKYDAFPELRDQPPTDDPKFRLPVPPPLTPPLPTCTLASGVPFTSGAAVMQVL